MAPDIYFPHDETPPAVVKVAGVCYSLVGFVEGTATNEWTDVTGEFTTCEVCTGGSSSSSSSSIPSSSSSSSISSSSSSSSLSSF